MRAILRAIWTIGVLVFLAATNILPHGDVSASGATTHYGRSSTYQYSVIGDDGWHGGLYGEDAIDLGEPAGNTVYFRSDSFPHYIDYELSYYGQEGGGTSLCTGRVYTLWWWDAAVSQWKYLIRENFVHLNIRRSSSAGQIAPYSYYEEWVGSVASTQNCGYTFYHSHFSRTLGVGSNAHNGDGTPGNYRGSSDIVFVAYD